VRTEQEEHASASDRELTLAELDERALRAARTWGHTPERERPCARSRISASTGRGLARGGLRGGPWRRAALTVVAAYVVNQLVKLAVPRAAPRLEGLPALIRTAAIAASPPRTRPRRSPAAPRLLAARGPRGGRSTRWPARWPPRGVARRPHPSDVLAGAVSEA